MFSKKQRREREQWIKSVPNANLNVTNNNVICQEHWPSDFDTIEVHGKIRPKNPPSVCPGVSTSQIPTSSAVQRTIKKPPVLLEINLLMNLMLFFRIR